MSLTNGKMWELRGTDLGVGIKSFKEHSLSQHPKENDKRSPT